MISIIITLDVSKVLLYRVQQNFWDIRNNMLGKVNKFQVLVEADI